MFGLTKRRQCDVCGSKLIRHFPNAQDLLLVLPLDQRKEVSEAFSMDGQALSSWKCGHCDNYGILFYGEIGL